VHLRTLLCVRSWDAAVRERTSEWADIRQSGVNQPSLVSVYMARKLLVLMVHRKKLPR